MHELPVTESIFKITMDQAKKNGAKKVNSITIQMGEGSDFVPEIIQEYFQIFSEGTICENAQIVSKVIPTEILCKACGKKIPKNLYLYNCPSCGSDRLRPLISGDLTVESIEMEFDE